MRRERWRSPSASTTADDPIPMIADRPSMRSRSERMSTLSATPVTAARATGRSRRLIHVQMAAASAASPTIDHTIEPAIATDTPASAVTAHHGAVADAHVTSPTERMISTASGTVEPVGDASLSVAARPAGRPRRPRPAGRPDSGSPAGHALTRRAAQPHRRATLSRPPSVGGSSRRQSRKPGPTTEDVRRRRTRRRGTCGRRGRWRRAGTSGTTSRAGGRGCGPRTPARRSR